MLNVNWACTLQTIDLNFNTYFILSAPFRFISFILLWYILRFIECWRCTDSSKNLSQLLATVYKFSQYWQITYATVSRLTSLHHVVCFAVRVRCDTQSKQICTLLTCNWFWHMLDMWNGNDHISPELEWRENVPLKYQIKRWSSNMQ